MTFHQPAHQGSIGFVQFVLLAKHASILGSQRRMVATAPLADVVKQARDVKQLAFWDTFDAAMGNGKSFQRVFVTETPHIPDHHHGVGIHGIDVE